MRRMFALPAPWKRNFSFSRVSWCRSHKEGAEKNAVSVCVSRMLDRLGRFGARKVRF